MAVSSPTFPGVLTLLLHISCVPLSTTTLVHTTSQQNSARFPDSLASDSEQVGGNLTGTYTQLCARLYLLFFFVLQCNASVALCCTPQEATTQYKAYIQNFQVKPLRELHCDIIYRELTSHGATSQYNTGGLCTISHNAQYSTM